MPVQDVKMSAAHFGMTHETILHHICVYWRASAVKNVLSQSYVHLESLQNCEGMRNVRASSAVRIRRQIPQKHVALVKLVRSR